MYTLILHNNYCWTALKYIKPLQFKTTPALKDVNRYTSTSMEEKKAMIRKSAFLKLPNDLRPDGIISTRIAHVTITKYIAFKELMSQ